MVEWGFSFYSPLYRGFLDLTGAKGTAGSYGPARKVIAAVLYHVFELSSSSRGDEIVILAKAPTAP